MTAYEPGEAVGRTLRSDAGPLLNLRLSFSGRPWRMGAAWSVLAGAVAAGASLTENSMLLRIVGALVLADPVWGVLWRITLARGHWRRSLPVATGILPYVQSGAPFSNIMRQMHAMSATAQGDVPGDAGWYEPLVGLGLAVGLSLLLGLPALVLSAVGLGIALLAWALNRRGLRPALVGALLTVGMPWALGASVATPASLSLTSRQVDSLVLALAFTVLAWGVRRAQIGACESSRGIWAGQAAVLAVLVGLHQPWTVAVVALLFLPPTWLLMASQGEPEEKEIALARCAIWWWLALLVAAFALR